MRTCLLLVAILAVSCGSSSRKICETGDVRACECPGDEQGTQACSADGTWGDCDCPCVPDCAGKECGPDGCGGTCGTCPDCDGVHNPSLCVDGACMQVCCPDCGGRECGDDGCGGVCGMCQDNEICDQGQCSCRYESCLDACCAEGEVCADGACCAPDCYGRECGDDGCGGSCGECIGCEGEPDPDLCLDGICAQVCCPDCTGRECGPDGCGGICGTCTDPEICNVSTGQCEACIPDCGGRECGLDPLCGTLDCGSCTAPETCNTTTGMCECIPDCGGKECGPDGCGGSCGTCTPPEVCISGGLCACIPDCVGRECGPDGCGGTCGTCTPPEVCNAGGQCECIPDCTGVECGPDPVCGTLDCGSCTLPEVCDSFGQCETCDYIPSEVANFDPVEKWHWGLYTTDPALCTAEPDYLQVTSTPMVANLTDDNLDGVEDENDIPEIIFPTYALSIDYRYRGRITALHGHNGQLYFQNTNADQLIDSSSQVAVGDINADGHVEIVAQLSRHYTSPGLIAFDRTGQELWRNTSPAGFWNVNSGSIAIADLDHDGSPEVVFARSVFDGTTGNLLDVGSESTNGTNQNLGGIPCVADFIPGGNMEILVGPTLYSWVDGPDPLQYEWRAQYLDGASIVNVPDGYCAVVDPDQDGAPEAVLSAEGKVFLIENDGTVTDWVDAVSLTGATNEGRLGPPLVADVDGDGAPEIGVSGYENYLVMEANLAHKWHNPIEDDSSSGAASTAYDFEGDGKMEIVHQDEYYLRVWDGTTGDILMEFLNSSRTRNVSPVVADVDNDGMAEILMSHSNELGALTGPGKPPVTGCGIRVFGDAGNGWVGATPIWNQHTYHITNIEFDGSVPLDEEHSWVTYNNYRAGDIGAAKYYAPDLVISSIVINGFVCDGPLDVTVTVYNAGSDIVPPGVPVALYADSATIAVASTTVYLYPGDSTDLSLTADPSPAGIVEIWAMADDDGTGGGLFNECDEGNNSLSAGPGMQCN